MSLLLVMTTTTATSTAMSNNSPNAERTPPLPPSEPLWCKEQQIYVGGVPENDNVKSLLLGGKEDQDGIYVFGYGSLCWNPGNGDGVLARPQVTSSIGRVSGYKRVWAQKSTDHRGTVKFPGIVCTLLTTDEVDAVRRANAATATTTGIESSVSPAGAVVTDPTTLSSSMSSSSTEGRIFHVPNELVDECLEELDFREKGGYQRDVIEVVEDETQQTHKALLYRGTVDNPAYWPRAMLDLPFAAATMSVAVGPSGPNDVYLTNLEKFLAAAHTSAADHDDTKQLASLLDDCRRRHLYFLFGAGSNQHNQLMLSNHHEDAHEQTEILMTALRETSADASPTDDRPVSRIAGVFAGGGHSALLSEHGKLFLFGWNEHSQCGVEPTIRSTATTETKDAPPGTAFEDVEPLGVLVETASLGFAHTLVLEKKTRRLLAFGDNRKGQVTGQVDKASSTVSTPTTPDFLKDDEICKVSAGVFHSAAITAGGELVMFGGDKTERVWKPPDDARLVDVACGRRHTVVVDDRNRIFTCGDNKYGQLGRTTLEKEDNDFALVENVDEVGANASNARPKIVGVHCGWSHTVVRMEDNEGRVSCYGWGRNDLGQLGTSDRDHVRLPRRLFLHKKVEKLDCGSECTMAIIDGQVWGCGWNEHGNLATRTQADALSLVPTVGAAVTSPPLAGDDADDVADKHLDFAVGGAHYLAAWCIMHPNA